MRQNQNGHPESKRIRGQRPIIVIKSHFFASNILTRALTSSFFVLKQTWVQAASIAVHLDLSQHPLPGKERR